MAAQANPAATLTQDLRDELEYRIEQGDDQHAFQAAQQLNADVRGRRLAAENILEQAIVRGEPFPVWAYTLNAMADCFGQLSALREQAEVRKLAETTRALGYEHAALQNTLMHWHTAGEVIADAFDTFEIIVTTIPEAGDQVVFDLHLEPYVRESLEGVSSVMTEHMQIMDYGAQPGNQPTPIVHNLVDATLNEIGKKAQDIAASIDVNRSIDPHQRMSRVSGNCMEMQRILNKALVVVDQDRVNEHQKKMARAFSPVVEEIHDECEQQQLDIPASSSAGWSMFVEAVLDSPAEEQDFSP